MTLTTIPLAELLSGDCRARLAQVMSPRVTVVVSCEETTRLPVAVVAAALEATTASGGFLRFEGVSVVARLALQVADPDHLLAVSEVVRAAHVGDRPFQVRLGLDGGMHVLLLKGIGQHPHMNEAAAYEWVRGLDATAVVVDMAHIEHLNSLLVAWLLQINQGVGAGRCRLLHVGRQAEAQLSQLRLNHLLSIG